MNQSILKDNIYRYLRIFIIVLNSILAVFLIILSVYFIINAPVNRDAGYYLSYAERFSEGMVPYKDIVIFHTPLAVLIMSKLSLLFGIHQNFSFYIVIQVIVNIINSFLFYFILKNILSSKYIRILAGLIFYLGNFYLAGFIIELEPWVVMFMLLTLLFYYKFLNNKKNIYIFFTGIAITLAFLCKQYGAFLVFPIGIHLLIQRNTLNNRVKEIIFFAIGGLTPIIIWIFYLVIIHKVPFKMLLTANAGRGYGYRSIPLAIKGYYNFVKWYASIVILFPFVIFNKKIFTDKTLHLLLLGILFAVPTFYFKQYDHYFILSYPFLILLGVFIIASLEGNFKDNRKWYHLILLIIAIILLIKPIKDIPILYKNTIEMAGKKELQIKVAKEISAHIPPKSRVMNMGSPAYTFLCNFMPPEDREFVYFFSYALSPEMMWKNLNYVNYVLRTPGFSLSTPATLLTPKIVHYNEDSVIGLIKSRGFFKLYTASDSVEIWRKK